MAKGWLINLTLLLFIALGGGALWWADKQESAKQTAEEKSREISALKQEAVKQILFRGEDGVDVTLVKKEGAWKIIAPKEVRTHLPSVERLLSVLAITYDKKVNEKPENLAAYALETPEARLTVQSEQGDSHTFILGGTPPTSPGQRYLQLGEQGPVVLVANTKAAALLQGFKELRDKRVFPIKPDGQQLSRIAITRHQEKLVLRKESDELWRMESPLADMASLGRVSVWLNMLSVTSSSDFQESDPPAQPDYRVELTNTAGSSYSLPIWREGEKLLGRQAGDPDSMVLPATLAKDLDKSPLELVELHPSMTHQEADHLTVEYQNKNVSAAKKEGRWPLAAWEAIEEAVIREAWQAVPPSTDTAPAGLTITVGEGESAQSFRLWQEGDSYRIAPPARPIHLLLSRLQSETLTKALANLFAPPSSPNSTVTEQPLPPRVFGQE